MPFALSSGQGGVDKSTLLERYYRIAEENDSGKRFTGFVFCTRLIRYPNRWLVSEVEPFMMAPIVFSQGNSSFF